MPLVNPPLKLSVAPTLPIKVGGSPSAGVGDAASAFDHVHPLTESGGANLSLGAMTDGDTLRRVANALVTRQFQIARLTTSPNSTSTAAADVSAVDFTFNLKANSRYLVLWIVFGSTSATTTGLMLGMHYAGTATLRYGLFGATALATMQSADTQTDDGLLGQAGVGPGGSSRISLLVGTVNPTTANTLRLRFATGVAASGVTIGAGSAGLLIEL